MGSPKDFETRQAVVRIALRCKQTVVPLFLLIHVLSIVSSKLARTLQTLLLLVSTLDCYIWVFIYFWHWPDVGYITIQAERKASSSSIHPSSSHAKNHAKPTATLPSSVAAAKPTASSHASDSVKGHVICRAFPDEKNGKISTTCRPAPTTTKTHGTHKRKAAQKTSSAKKAEKTEPAAEEAPSYTYRVALPSVDVSI